jgi:hypothetical protein
VEVHGGLTAGGAAAYHGFTCKDGWVFGFDCAHYDDVFSPLVLTSMRRGATYKTLDFVVAACEELAVQLACHDRTKDVSNYFVCSGCGVPQGKHLEYDGEPAYEQDNGPQEPPSPAQCGEWVPAK